jgi:hypothetical protein
MHYERQRRTGTLAPRLRPTVCAVVGCASKPQARGWCSLHYNRWHRFGDPEHVLSATRSAPTAPAPQAVLELWRRAVELEMLVRAVDGLFEVAFGPYPGDDWRPSEQPKARWRRLLGVT